MKRIILGVAALLITFAMGVGVEWFVSTRLRTSTPSIEPVVEDFKSVVKPVIPGVPAITPAATLPPLPERKIILGYDDQAFYPNGTYSILGSTPKEFSEFFSFETDYSEYVNDRPVGYISVNTKAGGGSFDSHSAVFGLVTERRVVFITSPDPKTEFEYLFDGNFIRSDFDVVANEDKAVVRGTLTKMKHGQKIAERTLSFRLARHGC